MPSQFRRPDPDALLARVREQERRASRGKLRIYFGASAGVGKTYAMLAASRGLRADELDVVVGVVETHGRDETEALLDGMEVLPRKSIEYRGRMLAEFDIDAALARRPSLILVDELAHSNAPGSRHPKRWQDVEELLDAGIDVFTTINVQHLESLGDAVTGITGIHVAETVPDKVFDAAEEVVLVDLPADELLVRLKAGKVYQAQQAGRAAQNFFRKGNLIALRELALRRTADRIEDDVLAYRVEKSIDSVWKTDAALLACVGPGAEAGHVVRGAARLASQLSAEWHAVYIETPALQRLPPAHRERILGALKLAQDLGAATAVLAGHDVARTAVEYARSHNFSKIVVGRARQSPAWRTSQVRRIAAHAPDLDLIEIGHASTKESGEARTASDAAARPDAPGQRRPRHWPYVWSVAASLLTALVALPLLPYFDLANIVMLFLLNVVLVAVRFGRKPAVLATFLGVAIFDFFFVQPRFSLAVSDVQYLLTFCVMLAVGLITGHLTANLRYQARVASQRESRSRALYEFARELSGAVQTEQIFDTTRDYIERTFRARTVLLLPDDGGHVQAPPATRTAAGDLADPGALDMGIAQWAYDRASPAGVGTDTLPASRYFYLPLIAPMRTRGVLAILPESRRWLLVPEQRRQLDTFAALTAIALERVHYIEVAQDALVRMESERLRNSLLAALSHDLRTPLTSLRGLSEALAMSRPPLAEAQRELADALHAEAMRMSTLVSNLLDMARIESGDVRLNLQWQTVEEIIGSALRAAQSLLARHRVETRLAPDLPLVRFDAVLMERVLWNLLENEAKYTPDGTTVTIAADVEGPFLSLTVSDDGPGLPPGKEEALFEKFTRGERESATSGVGLGLAICRAIVEAHGGEIHAGRGARGGASFAFTLPLGTPPSMPEPEDAGASQPERTS